MSGFSIALGSGPFGSWLLTLFDRRTASVSVRRRALLRIALLGTLLLGGWATDALADSAAVPAGWTHDPAASEQLTAKAAARATPGVSRSTVTVEAWSAPGGQGSLWFTRFEVRAAEPERDAIASAQLLELTATAHRQGVEHVDASSERADVAGRFLEGAIAWRDPDTISWQARTVVAADAERVVSITGECLVSPSALPAIEKACAASLAKIEPPIATKDRTPLAIVKSAPVAPVANEVAPSTDAENRGPVEAAGTPGPDRAPRLDPGPRSDGTLMTISPAPREPDRRPTYLGAGILLLAIVFWWNRRRRDRFDDDADDLQAAARAGADPDDPPKDET